MGGGLGKKEGGVFLRGWGYAHYQLCNSFNCDFNLLIPMSLLLISNKKKYYLAIDWLLIITFDDVIRK